MPTTSPEFTKESPEDHPRMTQVALRSSSGESRERIGLNVEKDRGWRLEARGWRDVGGSIGSSGSFGSGNFEAQCHNKKQNGLADFLSSYII